MPKNVKYTLKQDMFSLFPNQDFQPTLLTFVVREKLKIKNGTVWKSNPKTG